MELIKKILLEATYEKDSIIDEFIDNILNQIKNAFNNFNGIDSNEFEYNPDGNTVIFETNIDHKKLLIVFYDKMSKYADRANGGVHIFPDNKIKIYGCNLDWEEGDEELNSHWFDLDINENVLYHELVHFFDYNFRDDFKLKRQPYKIVRSTEEEKKKYYNHGIEFNAYFLQKVMPEIKKIKKSGIISNLTFQEFIKQILQVESIGNYYQKLHSNMKRNFVKRLSEYYQKIKK